MSDEDTELEETKRRLAHAEEWYATRFEALKQWAHQEGHTEVFAILANGTAKAGDPPTYAQQMNILKHRLAKAEEKALKYDLDQAGIEQRDKEAAELVELRAKVALHRETIANWRDMLAAQEESALAREEHIGRLEQEIQMLHDMITSAQEHYGHPSWDEKPKEDILKALRFQGGMTKELLDTERGWYDRMVEAEKELKAWKDAHTKENEQRASGVDCCDWCGSPLEKDE